MNPRRRNSVLTAALVLAAPLLALAVGRGVLQTPDGLSYLADVREGGDLIHPHHVLYGPLLAIAAAVSRPWGADLILAGQLLGCAAFAALLAAARRYLLGAGAWDLRPVLMLGLLASLRGLPLYSLRVEVYLPFLAAGAWLFALTAGRGEDAPPPSRRHLVTAAVLLALTALLHQMGALLALPLLAASWASRRERAVVVLGGGVAALAGYRLLYAGGGEDGFLAWLVTYATAEVSEWGSLTNVSASGWTALGHGVATLLVPIPAALKAVGAAACAALALGLAVLTRRARGRADLVYAAVALLVGAVFALWWLPTDTDFALPLVWPLWILTAAAWPRRRDAATLSVAVVLTAGLTYGLALPRDARRGTEERARIEMMLDDPSPPDDYGTRQRLRWARGGRGDRP